MSYLLDMKDADIVIIPEQHLWNKAITSVPTMLQDNEEIIQEIYRIVDSLRNPVVIFDGDIWHRGVPNTDQSLKLMSYPIMLHKKTNGRVFSVVGNHEITYKKNNIFWGVTNIQSPYILSTMRNISPQVESLITVVDELCVGDLAVVFGHYGRLFLDDNLDLPEEIEHSVYITHNSFGNSEVFGILNSKEQDLRTEFMNVTSMNDRGVLPPTDTLENVYVGHMHKAHGVFRVTENFNGKDYSFVLRYLASLGRTSHAEYTDDVVREIPILEVRNGKYIGERLETITLKERKVTVDEETVAINREKYDREVEIRDLRRVKVYSNNLLNSIEERLTLNTSLTEVLGYARSGEMPDFIQNIVKGGY